MKNTLLIIFLLLNILIGLSAQNNRFYVNAAATGANTGQSWADAFTNLQTGLQLAQAGDEIWVAQGTYKPTATTDRNIAFEPQSGVQVYGGFAGTENKLDERDWAAHPTVLSGDIGTAGDSLDNAYNVVYLHLPDSNTVLDGLVIRYGTANGTGSGSYARQRCGGGLYIDGQDWEAYAEIRNCIFERNSARNLGGGAIVNGSGEGSVAPRFWNCTFRENACVNSGGGLAWIGAAWVERGAEVDSSRFTANRSGFQGGGLYYQDAERTSTFLLRKSTLEKNTAALSGGAAHYFLGRTEGSSLEVSGCVIDSNTAIQGAAFAIQAFGFLTARKVEVDSCSMLRNFQPAGGTNRAIIQVDLLGIDSTSIYYSKGNYIKNNFCLGCSFVFISIQGKHQSIENVFVLNTIGGSFFRTDAKNLIRSISCISNDVWNGIIQSAFNDALFVNCFIIKNIFKNTILNSSIEANIEYTNCTISSNVLVSPLISTTYPRTLKFTNSIFESAYEKQSFFTSQEGTTIAHSYFDTLDCAALPPNVTCGPGILTGINPLFVDPDSGDYRLQGCSPLLDAGDNAYVMGATDLAGHPRIRGAAVDIGAYENQGPSLAAAPAVTPSCPGGASGAVQAEVQDACPPLSFAWQSGATSGSLLQGLPPGDYAFTITDSRGQTGTFTVTVPSGAAPAFVPLATPVLCGDTLGGTATAMLQPAAPPLQFLWAGGSADSLRAGLAAGSYPVTVTDAAGCTAAGTVVVDKTGSLSVDIEAQPISCHGAADGSFTVLAANGKAPFAWLWESGADTPTIGPLGPGTYTGTLTDALGCTIQWVLPLGEPGALQVNAQVQAASDSMATDGSILLLPTGGTGPYFAQWNTGAAGLHLDSLAAGVYAVTLTDAQGCSLVESFAVGVSSSAAEAGAGPGFTLYPNPAAAWLWLQPERAAGQDVPVRLLNAAGQTVLESVLPAGAGGLLLEVGLLPRGGYFVQVGAGVRRVVLR